MKSEQFQKYRMAHLAEMQTKGIDELSARARVFHRICEMTQEQRRTLIEDIKDYVNRHSGTYQKDAQELEAIEKSYFNSKG